MTTAQRYRRDEARLLALVDAILDAESAGDGKRIGTLLVEVVVLSYRAACQDCGELLRRLAESRLPDEKLSGRARSIALILAEEIEKHGRRGPFVDNVE